MADIRIKDITTTASASLTGDFLPIDGTTGTRKLSAFSPTFGGNATVTGTLTVNGTGTNSIPNLSVTGIGGLNVSANFLTSANTLRFSDSAAGGQTWFMSPQLGDGVATNFAFYSNDGVTSTPLFRVSSAGVFRLPSTAASTTTSSGALVVSGGVGVGGAINAGGDIATASTMRSVGFHVPGNGAGRPANTDSYLASTATTQIPLYVSGHTGGGQSADILRVSLNSSSDWFAVKGNGQVTCLATTASTSTSSGALVVGNGTSGGLGVGGSINTGGTLRFHTNANLPGVGSMGISATYGLNMYASTGSSYDFTVFNAAGSSLILNPTGTQNLTFPGTVTAGGTITSNNGSGSGLLGMRSSSGNASYVFWSETGVADRGILGFNNGSSTLSYRSFSSSFSTGTEVFSISSAGNTTVAGTLTANGTTLSLSTASANGSFINMDGLAGNFKIITTRTGGVDRWYFGQDTAAESGSNAGSPFFIRALTDAGAVIDTPLTITRAAGGRITTQRPVTISDSTASTSTSSGALVVSGGVGVAKGVTIGETTTSYGILTTSGGDSDSVYGVSHYYGSKGATYATSFLHKVSTSHSLTASANKWKLSLCDGTSTGFVDALEFVAANATFFGSVKTAAPSGGTAANWKLGTVATVSPTSPNRTIEVDIGGTIYYIHAKTTNN